MKKQFKETLDFYNNSTPQQRCDFLSLIAKDIMVAVKTKDGIHCLSLDNETSTCINGSLIQLNTEPLSNN